VRKLLPTPAARAQQIECTSATHMASRYELRGAQHLPL